MSTPQTRRLAGNDGEAKLPGVVLPTGPVEGKTYSLYGAEATSDGYFAAVHDVVEACLDRTDDPARLVEEIALAGRGVGWTRRAGTRTETIPALAETARRLDPFFAKVAAPTPSLPIT